MTFKKIISKVIVLLILWVPDGLAKIPNSKSLVFQWQVSHLRNTDQISVIFRPHYAELVVNTSNWQTRKPPRLGRFYSPITSKLKKLKNMVTTHYIYLQKTESLLSVVNKNLSSPLIPPVTPHAPIIKINDYTIHAQDMYFKNLEKEMYKIWTNHRWKCLECAFYKKLKGSIVRTSVRRQGVNLRNKPTQMNNNIQPNKNIKKIKNKKMFKKGELSCFLLNKNTIECIDQMYGTFKLSVKLNSQPNDKPQ